MSGHDGSRVLPAEDAEHAAFVVKMIVGLGKQGIRHRAVSRQKNDI